MSPYREPARCEHAWRWQYDNPHGDTWQWYCRRCGQRASWWLSIILDLEEFFS